MKISKSKQGLASIISENGGWRDGAEWSIQDRDKNIEFMTRRPEYMKYVGAWYAYASRIGSFKIDNLLPNFHQTILSRAEYFHLYPAPDADGWIEWNGGDCPVGEGDRIDVKFSDGDEFFDVGSDWGWDVDAGGCNIIAYRLHKQEKKSISSDDVNLILVVDGEEHEVGQGVEVKETDAKPEFCESVMRSIPEPEINSKNIDITQVDDTNVVESKPTIEQLATDYRNAKDYADRKQQEADAAKADADEKLRVLEIAGEAIGLIVSPITEKQEPELVITNRSQLELGDVIWLSDSTVKENNELTPSGEYTVVKVGVIGVESDGQTIYPDFSTREWRFIRRP